MDNKIYVVSFIRQGNLPNEDYYYNRIEDAKYHFSLFKEDDSGLYKSIRLIEQGQNKTCIKELLF